MSRRKMFVRVVWRAIWVERGRVASAVAALAVGATLSSAFLNLYLDLPRKMTAEFRGLGANLVLAPAGGAQTYSQDISRRMADDWPQVKRLEWLYAVGKVRGREATLGGTDLDALAAVNPAWKVRWRGADGQPLGGSEEMIAALRDADWLLAGERAAGHFGWEPGERVEVEYGGRTRSLPLAGIISAGGSADTQLLLPLGVLQELTGRDDEISLVEVLATGSAAQIEALRQAMAARLPEVDVRPVRQVVEAEAHVVMKVRGLMLGLTLVVLAIVVLSVLTTVSGLVLDRRKEIGVLKALGGNDGVISAVFVAQALLFAVAAAAAGYGTGYALAQWGSVRIFDSALQWRWEVLPAVILVTMTVALAGSALPVRLIRRMHPAEVLRGN